MSVGSAIQAWKAAEEACLQKLSTILGGDLSAYGTTGKLPRFFPADSTTGMWAFRIVGGGDRVDGDFNFKVPGGMGGEPYYSLPAFFESAFTNRDDALFVCGQIMESFPLPEDSIGNVFRCYHVENPRCEPDVMERSPDQSKGGPIEVWRTECQFVVWFKKAKAT